VSEGCRGDSPWEPVTSGGGLPADTASGQGQAFHVSGPNLGDRSLKGACKPEL
jgi:hypothetical protein